MDNFKAVERGGLQSRKLIKAKQKALRCGWPGVCVLWVGCEGRRLGRGESVAVHDVLSKL